MEPTYYWTKFFDEGPPVDGEESETKESHKARVCSVYHWFYIIIILTCLESGALPSMHEVSLNSQAYIYSDIAVEEALERAPIQWHKGKKNEKKRNIERFVKWQLDPFPYPLIDGPVNLRFNPMSKSDVLSPLWRIQGGLGPFPWKKHVKTCYFYLYLFKNRRQTPCPGAQGGGGVLFWNFLVPTNK